MEREQITGVYKRPALNWDQSFNKSFKYSSRLQLHMEGRIFWIAVNSGEWPLLQSTNLHVF